MTTLVAPDRAPAPVRLAPLDRLAELFDAGSLEPIRSSVAGGMLAASGLVCDRPAFAFAHDPGCAGGAVGAANSQTITRVLELADTAGAPVVGFVESAGARIQEGVAALDGYGRIFSANVALSGRVPQISVVTGPSAGGGCYSPALTDFVVMTERARMFLTGPKVVREAIGEEVDAASLGGRRVHERNGVCHFVADDDARAARLARRLLGYLPQRAGGPLPRCEAAEPIHSDPSAVMPSARRAAYDVRGAVGRIADAGSMLEVHERWARNIVTAFARLGGLPVGVVANQPRHLGGLIDVAAAEKGAAFVRTCDRFGLPIVTLVDTPGFMPGVRQESFGVIRHGAQLVRAYAASRVPRVTVITRKAYGGAYIAMNSKALGAALVYAWPEAEVGIMGAAQAVGIVHRDEIARASDPAARREQLAASYSQDHVSALGAARRGYVDEIIQPRETRARLCNALARLGGGGAWA